MGALRDRGSVRFWAAHAPSRPGSGVCGASGEILIDLADFDGDLSVELGFTSLDWTLPDAVGGALPAAFPRALELSAPRINIGLQFQLNEPG